MGTDTGNERNHIKQDILIKGYYSGLLLNENFHFDITLYALENKKSKSTLKTLTYFYYTFLDSLPVFVSRQNL